MMQPTHVLFTSLSHQLKGYNTKLVAAEVDRMITVLGLDDKRHVQAQQLSGGMKRKLCVGIALIGDSKVRAKVLV